MRKIQTDQNFKFDNFKNSNMNKYEISPLTVKSGESLRYSESECTKDERNNVNVSRRSSVEYDGGSQQFSNTVVNNYKSLNADLTEQCDYQPPENIEETKIAEGDGTFKFILTEVVSGKTKVDLCYQSHASEWWYSQHSNSSMNYSNDNGMGSVEHSVENSDFIRNLMHRRNLSPPSGEKNSRDDPQIFVGSLSDASNESNIQITDPCSEDPFGENHPIRVESNKDSEDWDDASERLRYPLLHEIPEQHPEVETDGQSSFLKRGLEESKYSNEFSNGSQDLWDENYNPHEDNPVISAEGLPSNNNQNYLHPGHFSPETRSQQTLSNSSNCCLSPPASTFGINTTQSLDQQPIRPEESSENMNKGTSTVSKKSKFAKLAKSDMSLSKFSPVSGKKEEIHSTKSASPPKDITNLQHSNCRCTGCSNEQHTKFMLQNLMQTTDHKDGDNNYKENESSPQKLSSPVSSTENKISTEEKVYPQVYDNSTQDYFNKKESPEKDGQNNEENHKNVSQEYGLHNSSSECENIEPFYNDSKEDIFTHKDNNSMERQQIECDNDTQFSPISKIDDSHEDSSSLDKVPVKETDLVQPARSTKPKEIKNVKKKMITVKTNENLGTYSYLFIHSNLCFHIQLSRSKFKFLTLFI